MFEDVLRFWLDRGVDGFRVDVAHGLFKADGLPDSGDPEERAGPRRGRTTVERHPRDEPMWDQPEVHDIYRAGAGSWRRSPATGWRSARPGPRRRGAWPATCAPTSCNQTFNFHWLTAPWSATRSAR